MDMWDPFIAATVDHVPDGRDKIVFDRYHIMAHMNKAVDQVRRGEHRRLQEEGDDTLKGTKYLWLFAEENLPEKRAEDFEWLRTLHLKTGRAWAIKESLRHLWDLSAEGLCVAVLEELVLLGHAFASEAGGEGGEDDPGAFGQRVDLFRSSHHQRHQ